MNTGTKIMVIDDEESMTALLSDFLSSQGYHVGSYSSATSALGSLCDPFGRLQYQAIISDIKLGPISGLELLVTVKASHPLLPVLLFTAAGSADQKARAEALGAAHYLVKPFPLAELGRLLHGALAIPPL